MVPRVGSTIGALLVLCGMLTGCGSRPVVGVILPSTGAASTYGESLESGMRLAITDARAAGQLPAEFEVLWADSGSSPERAVAELERLTTERDVRFVLGGATSAEARAMIPKLEDLDVILLSPSASAPDISRESRNFFRIYPSDSLEGNTAGNFLYDRLGQEKVVLYVGDSEYARGIEPEFRKQYEEALGGTVVARIDLTDPDWQQQSAQALRSSGAGAVFIIAYAEQDLAVLRHLREVGFEGRILATSAFYSSRVIHEAGDLADGLLFPLPPFDRTSDKEPVVSFVHRYMETYQRPPDVYAAHGYDAMRLAVDVLEMAKPPETSEIRRALSFGLSEFSGVTGPILFDDYGDVKHYPKMFIVDQGQILTYQRYTEIKREEILRKMTDLLRAGQAPAPTPVR